MFFRPLIIRSASELIGVAEIEVALFPGYVFCQFDPNRRLPF